MKQVLEEKLKKLGMEVNEKQINDFDNYYQMLIKWNKVMNLTAITEYEEVIEKHFVDSLSIIKAVNINTVKSVIDIGTGAGFPGIPLKIMFPHLKVVLLDSLNKRIKFLDHVIQKLSMDHIYTIHGRAEDYAKSNEYREQFDLGVSRAVANLSTLSEYCIPYITKGGKFVSYKSGNIDEEAYKSKQAIHMLGGKINEIVRFELEDSRAERSFIIIDKVNHTLNKYPRKAGLPAKEPL